MAWRQDLASRSRDELENSKNFGHYPPGKRPPPERLQEIFQRLRAMAEGTGHRVQPSDSGAEAAPLQTLVIRTEAQREQLEKSDAASREYQQMDQDFVRGDWLARLFYGCMSDDAEYELREVVWRYTQMDFLFRFAMKIDAYCYDSRHRDERVCCGVMDPRGQLDLYQILYPENWNTAYGCPYRQWADFLRDYNAWGRGEAPQPRWMPKAPSSPKKAAEDVMAVYLVSAVPPITRWFFGHTKTGAACPPLVNGPLVEQFLLRCNPLNSTEPALASIYRCIYGNPADKYSGFYEVALQMWSRYATFVPGPVEQHMFRHDMRAATDWTRHDFPSSR